MPHVRLLPLALLAACASTALAEGRTNELQLLKSRVILYEPVYARVHPGPDQWQGFHCNSRGPEVAFESRALESEKWVACPFRSWTGDYFAGTVCGPPRGDARGWLAPTVLNRLDDASMVGCNINRPGKYQIRWMGGPPVTLVVLPVPKNERAAAALMTGTPLTPDASFRNNLAASVYAGYVLLLHFFPTGAMGPKFEANARSSQESFVADNADDPQVGEYASFLRRLLESRRSDALTWNTQLTAHPEFIFADDVRMLLADDLVFLGRCSEALRQLKRISSDDKREIAANYLGQLEDVRTQPNSICSD
jgi:hypothetical protein